MTTPPPRLCVIVPCFDEEATVAPLHARLAATLAALGVDWRVLYVYYGSRDGTGAALAALAGEDPRVGVLALSRNFGKEIAMSAGLDLADADAVSTWVARAAPRTTAAVAVQ